MSGGTSNGEEPRQPREVPQPVCAHCGQPVWREGRSKPWVHVEVPEDRHVAEVKRG